MKHLLGGIAVAAALAIAAPGWAQSAYPGPDIRGTKLGDPSMNDTTMASPRNYHNDRAARSVSRGRMLGRQGTHAGDVANQLNQQELSRLQAGSSTPPAGLRSSSGR